MSRATAVDVIEGRAQPHELPPPLADLWRDGFHAGAAVVRKRLEQLEDELNYWYWRAVAPQEHAARIREILDDYDAQTARNQTAERWAALDAAVQEARAS